MEIILISDSESNINVQRKGGKKKLHELDRRRRRRDVQWETQRLGVEVFVVVVVVAVVVGSGRGVAVLPARSRPGNIRHATHT